MRRLKRQQHDQQGQNQLPFGMSHLFFLSGLP